MADQIEPKQIDSHLSSPGDLPPVIGLLLRLLAQRWPQLMRDASVPGRAWVVPTELPSESLAAMGLPYDPAHAGEPVRAELLVHANGDVLAVRFVR